MDKIIGRWDDTMFFRLAIDLIEATDDKQKIKIFMRYIKQYNDLSLSNFLSVAIYTCPHLEKSLNKLIILI
jgi:hypothetical protein